MVSPASDPDRRKHNRACLDSPRGLTMGCDRCSPDWSGTTAPHACSRGCTASRRRAPRTRPLRCLSTPAETRALLSGKTPCLQLHPNTAARPWAGLSGTAECTPPCGSSRPADHASSDPLRGNRSCSGALNEREARPIPRPWFPRGRFLVPFLDRSTSLPGRSRPRSLAVRWGAGFPPVVRVRSVLWSQGNSPARPFRVRWPPLQGTSWSFRPLPFLSAPFFSRRPWFPILAISFLRRSQAWLRQTCNPAVGDRFAATKTLALAGDRPWSSLHTSPAPPIPV